MSSFPLKPLSFFGSPQPLSPPRFPWRVAAAALFSTVALAGCTTPMLHSTVDVPAHFADVAATDPASAPEVAWWKAYHDPVLDALIERAARQNRDVRIATEHV